MIYVQAGIIRVIGGKTTLKPSKGRSKERMKASNGGGSIDCAARSWSDLAFSPMPQNGQMDVWLYALQVLHREEKSTSSLILQERASVLRYLCRYTLGEGLRRFFCVPHSGHVAHRVGFCFPSLHYALLIDMQPLRPVSRRFVSLQKYFSVRKRFTAFTRDI